jgi:hypothetical protein
MGSAGQALGTGGGSMDSLQEVRVRVGDRG